MSNGKVDELGKNVADISLDSEGGEWDTCVRKSKNKSLNKPGKQWGQQTVNPPPKTWVQQTVNPPSKVLENNGKSAGNDWQQPKTGRGNSFSNNLAASGPAIGRPLQNGWNWSSTAAAAAAASAAAAANVQVFNNDDSDEDDVFDVFDDSDEDGYDSCASEKSHETRKKHKMFAGFFKVLDKCKNEELNDVSRKWHCPACQGGPGAIYWYKGLPSIVTHAKSRGAIRMKLHRELATLLDEELRIRGASVVPAGEAFGQWRGLSQQTLKDREIVWPPMVIIMNTKLERGEDDKWIGMGNPELLRYFDEYNPSKARHAYGPQGHRGMSILIFDSSATGHMEAYRLSSHFQDQGTDRDAWERNPVLFYPGGKRQLYGYMADKKDMDVFNQHCQGKGKLKYELRSYNEMVLKPTRQMNEDNQLLMWSRDRLAKEQMRSRDLEESLGIASEKLQKTKEENRIVKMRFKKHHQETKEEIVFQEEFFNDQIKMIREARVELETKFEKMQQDKREMIKQFSNHHPNSSSRNDEIANFIKFQEKEMGEFVGEREKLIKCYEVKKEEMRKKQWKEEVELEKGFDLELNCLMKKYTPANTK
ncbi:protein SUPPRESSOR OF GENE SILENCING 3-like [Impatiens glandulifera]|uniref:protein SUPPRESSOR OF GENE SILENCING 3-like n=1 Tax=Impatiens glandulifera TaxID=253017 RepID=UPI001FB16A73|nr:protein SUPPRESSOR OF GENE SILENCING 3-like [Impatiens glandulifera]